MSLLDTPKDSRFEQAVITSIDRTTGRVGVFLRNGLHSTATYLYDLKDLREGLSVIVSKVSNHWVIVNRITEDAIRKSYSTTKTSTILSTPSVCEATLEKESEIIYVGDTLWIYVDKTKPNVRYKWSLDGPGSLSNEDHVKVKYTASSESGTAEVILSLEDGTICDSITIHVIPYICEATIGYTTQSMSVYTHQTLTVVDPEPGRVYKWRVLNESGEPCEECGSISPEEGLSVVYNSPTSNPNCLMNPIIELTMEGSDDICDTLKIAVNGWEYGTWYAWEYVGIYYVGCMQYISGLVGDLIIWGRTSYKCSGEFVAYEEDVCFKEWAGSYNPTCQSTVGLCDYDKYSVTDSRDEFLLSVGCCPPQLM